MKIITKAVLDMEIMQWVSIESYDYEGPVDLACGPSGAEKSIAGKTSAFGSTLQNDFTSRFKGQSDTLDSLNRTLSPIVEAGPSQQGFSPEELAAKNTQALNTTGANYANAARAVQGKLFGRGGDSGLESGIDQQIQGTLASEAAGQLSSEELGITNASYDTGRKNFLNALSGEQILAKEFDPTQYSSQATNTLNSAFSESETIQKQQSAKEKAIAGGVVGLATDALTFGMGGIGNLDTAGTSSSGEQFGNFFSGGLKALSGA